MWITVKIRQDWWLRQRSRSGSAHGSCPQLGAALFAARLKVSQHAEDFYVLFLTNFNRQRMCHGMLNFMEILLENNIISRCITPQWPGAWTINF